jgi:hypothetical protein
MKKAQVKVTQTQRQQHTIPKSSLHGASARACAKDIWLRELPRASRFSGRAPADFAKLCRFINDTLT